MGLGSLPTAAETLVIHACFFCSIWSRVSDSRTARLRLYWRHNSIWFNVGLCFPLAEDLFLAGRLNLRAFCRSFLSRFCPFCILLRSVCGRNLAVFLLTFCGVYNWNWNNEISWEAATQEVTIMETVGIDNPPGDITMFDEALGGLRGLNSFLHARTFAGRAALSEQTIVLDVEVKVNILDNQCQR